MSPQIRLAAARPNLRRAWQWTHTNTDRTHREYFQPLYRAFALAAEDRLEEIRTALLTSTYAPSHATKLYFPKPGGIQRVYTLLTIEDQIVYQALVNVTAERLYSRVHRRYYRSVFGHLYAGKESPFFYRNWRSSYNAFTRAIQRAYADGLRVTASFDLTACYDSIDHEVLSHFLKDLGFDQEYVDLLCHLLKHWTEVSGKKEPIYHGHGIPQGPLPSGLLAEVVLRHFDNAPRRHGLRYMRYVDDIRLFAGDERTLRRELLQLDIRSKEIGLFPQSSKINIHRITTLDEEIKSISRPPEPALRRVAIKQHEVRRRLVALTPRLRVSNPTRFKYVLGHAEPSAALSLRLCKIIQLEPWLYDPVCRYLAKAERLSKRVSAKVLAALAESGFYPGYSAAILRAVQTNFHPTLHSQLFSYCRSRLFGGKSSTSAELRAAAGAILLRHGQLNWKDTRSLLAWRYSWWLRAWTAPFLREDILGTPSYERLVHDLLCDNATDVALVAAELLITHKLATPTPIAQTNRAAQQALRSAGRIGRVSGKRCVISAAMVNVLGQRVKKVNWRRIFSKKTYRLMFPRVAVWKGYALTDPTGWVALSDTINDIIIDALYAHDNSLGTHVVGNIGSVLQPNSRFARSYPRFFAAAEAVHRLRLRADIAHPVTRGTQIPTRRIRHKEMRALFNPLADGYLELWAKW